MTQNNEFEVNNEIEEFLILSKTLKGTSLIPIITRSLNNPKIFNYSSLLNCTNISELQNIQEALPYYNLLKLFCYGSLRDYLDNTNNLPELTDKQLKKLKILTLLNLASEKKKLPYSILERELQVDSIRELEDIIIEAIFSNLIKGKMNQKEACLLVEDCLGRSFDTSNHDELIDDMIQKLSQWLHHSESLSDSLKLKLEQANNAQLEMKARQEAASKKQSKSKDDASTSSAAMDCD